METTQSTNWNIIAKHYGSCFNQLVTYFVRHDIDEDTCKDLAQDVMLRAMKTEIPIKEEQFMFFLIRIACNIRIDYVRKQTIRQSYSTMMEKLSTAISVDNVEKHIFANELAAAEQSAVKRMNRRYAQVYSMSREGLSVDEISDSMDLTKRKVNDFLYRSRQFVRGELKRMAI